MILAEHARDLFLRLSAIDGEPDEIVALIVGALEGAIAAERERCVLEVVDWFTLPPRSRTKERLLAAIRKGE